MLTFIMAILYDCHDILKKMIKKKTNTATAFEKYITKNKLEFSKALDLFFKGIKQEAIDTQKTSTIIQTFVINGTISKKEELFLKQYIYDLLKVVGIGIPFVLIPGASIIIPFVIKAAQKRNIDILPSNFNKNKIKS